MESENTIIDTTLIIDFLRKKDKSKAILYHLMNELECSISIITDFEIRVGITSAFRQDEYNTLINDFHILSIEKPCIDQAVEIFRYLKQKNALVELADLLIGATAVRYSLQIATFNRKHFDRIPDLRLLALPDIK